ncbi:MAG: hypothetical protein PHX87_04740 [Candidatus Peribacteraceae bacterium]|nr:hypothetical protein [Candidatus Peribacteraceae bacterium]MDD5742704.1 hypothetical protein [Candidatus Peribacteraceae bacterium]
MLWFILLAGFAFLSLAFVLWASMCRRTKIPHLQKAHFRQAWDDAVELKDPSRRVMEAEKVCDAVLKSLDYTGTFAEKLKQAQARLTHVDDIWNAHRLRNRIAHEVDVRVSAAQSDRALRAFAVIIRQFLS